MDKPKLSKDQLLELVIYIKRRGFIQPLLITEILDHFACKVEEKMAAYPGITLEKAITDAHADFGFSGFAPIVSAFQGNLKKKYADIYKAEVKNTLMRPIPVILSVLAFLAFYNGFLWAGKNHYNHVADINDACFGLYLTYMLSSLFIAMKFFSGFKPNLIKTALFNQDIIIIVLFIFLFPMMAFKYGIISFSIMSIVGSFSSAYLIIRQFSLYNALIIGNDENTLIENYMNGIRA